jgi:hypothetical protein
MALGLIASPGLAQPSNDHRDYAVCKHTARRSACALTAKLQDPSFLVPKLAEFSGQSGARFDDCSNIRVRSKVTNVDNMAILKIQIIKSVIMHQKPPVHLTAL